MFDYGRIPVDVMADCLPRIRNSRNPTNQVSRITSVVVISWVPRGWERLKDAIPPSARHQFLISKISFRNLRRMLPGRRVLRSHDTGRQQDVIARITFAAMPHFKSAERMPNALAKHSMRQPKSTANLPFPIAWKYD